MSFSQGKSADQGYFVGHPKTSENPDHQASSDGVAQPPVLRMPSAAQLPTVARLPRVDPQIGMPRAILIGPDTWGGTLVSPPPSRAVMGVKIFLIVLAIAAPIAIFFADETWLPDADIVSAWKASLIDRQAAMPAPQPKAEFSTARPLNMDIATLPPADTPRGIALPPALPPPTEAAVATRIEAEPETHTAPAEPTTRFDSVQKPVAAEIAPSQPTAGETMTTDRRTADHEVIAAPKLNVGNEAPRVRNPQAGVWTYCTVNLIPGGQIAVQKATTYRTCISAGKKCAGNRRYADIQFFDRPTLTSKVPLESCDTES